MSGRGVDYESILLELLRLPPEQRRWRLQKLGRPRETLTGLAEETERLVIGDLHRALDASAMLVELADDLGDARLQAAARRVRGLALAYANR